jgi:hypothetical protein
VLDFTLGSLDLNLLGLMVHLNQVHLTITADSTGGVLGNLLCSLAGGGGGARASSKQHVRRAGFGRALLPPLH